MTKNDDKKSQTNEKSVLILSGGMDSTTLLYKLVSEGKKIFALSFNYGQKHKKELKFARYNCKKLNVPHKIIDLSGLKEQGLFGKSSLTSEIDIPEGHYEEPTMKSTVVPNRNMIMLSIAISYAISIGAKTIYYGAHAGDHAVYPDCRPEFVEKMQKVAESCHYYPISINAPFLHIDKGDIVAQGLKLNVDYSKTWTCYKGQEKACGKCGSCVERLEAFEKNGISDPLQYSI
ncbi:MAG: 7-cyano-7-deazaguanine synthase QueC [Candidatus Lokiarchaeota archaeon]|nr:7-cyano-7-deazaguanine synthase QueC [Candidatus Lokiarchaeota archaeon]